MDIVMCIYITGSIISLGFGLGFSDFKENPIEDPVDILFFLIAMVIVAALSWAGVISLIIKEAKERDIKNWNV